MVVPGIDRFRIREKKTDMVQTLGSLVELLKGHLVQGEVVISGTKIETMRIGSPLHMHT
jgi:hypothetical protein